MRGLTSRLLDAKPEHNTMLVHQYDWATPQTRVLRPDMHGTLQTTTYGYNGAGQVTKVTDPLGNVTDNGYDEFLRPFTVKQPGSSQSTYAMAYYPNSNQMQTLTNEAGEVWRRGANTKNGDTRYTLDPLNEQRRVDHLDYQATVFNRDATTGNITSIATSRYAKDTNLDLEPMPAAQAPPIRSVSFVYEAGGLIDYMLDAKGNKTDFT